MLVVSVMLHFEPRPTEVNERPGPPRARYLVEAVELMPARNQSVLYFRRFQFRLH